MRNLRSQRKSYIREEKRSIRRQRKKLKQLKRKRWWRYFKKDLFQRRPDILDYPKNLVKVKKRSPREKFLKQLVRKDNREARQQQLKSFITGFNIFSDKNKPSRNKRFSNWNSLHPLVKAIESKEMRVSYITLLIKSTVMFIIAFWGMYFIGHLISIFTAQYFSIPSVLHSYGIYWPLDTVSSLYTRNSIVLIFGVAPSICLLGGITMALLFSLLNKRYIYLRLFFLWMSFHGINMFFGAYVSGIATQTGMSYVSNWIFGEGGIGQKEIIFSLIAIVSLIAFGYSATRRVLLIAPNSMLIRPAVRALYILFQVALPWAFGSTFILMTNVPNFPIEFILLLLVSIFLVLPLLFNFNSIPNRLIKISSTNPERKTTWLYIIIFVVATLLIRLFIFPGIHFN